MEPACARTGELAGRSQKRDQKVAPNAGYTWASEGGLVISIRRPPAFRGFHQLYCDTISPVFTPGVRRVAPVVLAILITIYGGLVRLDAVVERYGPVEHPGWARVRDPRGAPMGRGGKAGGTPLERIASPYAGGDPINYLRFAREMRTFYQPHVPGTGVPGVDAGVPLALLRSGRRHQFCVRREFDAGDLRDRTSSPPPSRPPLAGVAAALLLACEYELITWARRLARRYVHGRGRVRRLGVRPAPSSPPRLDRTTRRCDTGSRLSDADHGALVRVAGAPRCRGGRTASGVAAARDDGGARPR